MERLEAIKVYKMILFLLVCKSTFKKNYIHIHVHTLYNTFAL